MIIIHRKIHLNNRIILIDTHYEAYIDYVCILKKKCNKYHLENELYNHIYIIPSIYFLTWTKDLQSITDIQLIMVNCFKSENYYDFRFSMNNSQLEKDKRWKVWEEYKFSNMFDIVLKMSKFIDRFIETDIFDIVIGFFPPTNTM